MPLIFAEILMPLVTIHGATPLIQIQDGNIVIFHGAQPRNHPRNVIAQDHKDNAENTKKM